MKITLSKVSHNTRLSEETHAFDAVVCLDDVPAFRASNHGTGGCNEYHPLVKRGAPDTQITAAYRVLAEKVAEAEAYVKTLPTVIVHGAELHKDLDWVIAEALEDYFLNRDVQRILYSLFKRVITFKYGELFTYKSTGVTVEAQALQIKTRHPEETVLNLIPSAEAEKLIRQVLTA